MANARIHGTTRRVPREHFEQRRARRAPAARGAPVPPARARAGARHGGAPTRATPPCCTPSTRSPCERRGLAAYDPARRGGGLMAARARHADRPSLRDRLRAQLADLKMPGALESLDAILAGLDGGALQPPAAIEALLGAQIALRNNRRLQAAMRSSGCPRSRRWPTSTSASSRASSASSSRACTPGLRRAPGERDLPRAAGRGQDAPGDLARDGRGARAGGASTTARSAT